MKKYTAYVINDSGASESAGEGNNLSALKAAIRARYGRGWTVVIEENVPIEEETAYGTIIVYEQVTVAQFTLRK